MDLNVLFAFVSLVTPSFFRVDICVCVIHVRIHYVIKLIIVSYHQVVFILSILRILANYFAGPICRAPFRALLQIRAVQKSSTPVININPQDSTENIPLGYIPVSLIEALNGPGYKRNSIDRQNNVELMKKDIDLRAISPSSSLKKISNSTSSEQFKQNSTDESSDLLTKRSPLVARSSSKEKKSLTRSLSNRDRDCVKYINEKSENQDIDDENEDSEAEKLSPLLVTDERLLEKSRIKKEESIDEIQEVFSHFSYHFHHFILSLCHFYRIMKRIVKKFQQKQMIPIIIHQKIHTQQF